MTVSPLSEIITLATEQDLVLETTPLNIPLMLALWNSQQALALHLEHYLGTLSDQALKYLETKDFPRGGKVLHSETPHHQFQQLEKEEFFYLDLEAK